MINSIKNQIAESVALKTILLSDKTMLDLIADVTKITINAYKEGNKTLIAGNGGSAADAQHFAAEFVGRFYSDRPGLASHALTVDSSVITAIGNDYGYKNIFSRQIQANGEKGDIFFAISTSGNSPNIIEALDECKKMEIISVGLTGDSGGLMKDLCDYCFCVPSKDTPRIQESHILIEHIICSLVEKELFPELS